MRRRMGPGGPAQTSRKMTVPDMASEIALMMQSKRNSTSQMVGSICSTGAFSRAALPAAQAKSNTIGVKVK